MTDGIALSVASPDVASIFDSPLARCTTRRTASSLHELAEVLSEPAPKAQGTLDLLGHSTSGHHLLRLGGTAIDMLDPGVARFFRGLTTSGCLESRGITAIRLLGCGTALTDAGKRTMRMLSRTTGRQVFGTLASLMGSHYTEQGFDPTFDHLLVEAAHT